MNENTSKKANAFEVTLKNMKEIDEQNKAIQKVHREESKKEEDVLDVCTKVRLAKNKDGVAIILDNKHMVMMSNSNFANFIHECKKLQNKRVLK